MRIDVRNLAHPALALLFLLGGGLVGCQDATGPGGEDPPREQNEPEPPPAEGKIVHANDNDCNAGTQKTCYPIASTGVEYPLKAKVQDGSKNPSENRVVKYEIVNNTVEGFSLSARQQTTEENGVAETMIRTPEKAGKATIKATTTEEKLGAIQWEVSVSPKGGAGYRVQVTYDGDSEVNETEVSLFASDKSCDDLRSQWATRRDLENPGHGPGSITSQREPLNPASGGTYERTFNFVKTVEKEKSYVVWARAFKLKQPDTEPDVELAWGCKKGDKIDSPQPVTVEIDLNDHIPILKEKYEVTHHFDLVDVLPDSVEKWVRRIGLFVKSPGAFLVGCKPGDQAVKSDGTKIELCPDGEVDGLFDIFTNSDIIGEDVKGWIEDLINNGPGRQVIRDTVDGFIQDQVFDQVGWANAARNITKDIFATLTNFGVKGPMRFENQPMPTYQNGEAVLHIDSASQTWHEFGFYWVANENCSQANDYESCRLKWFKTSEFMDETVIEGDFKATVGGINSLDIEEHSLTFNLGPLLIGVLEHIVLPRYFSGTVGGDDVVKDVDDNGDGSVTFDELIGGTLVNCSGLADREPLGDGNGSVNGTIEKAVDRFCTNLRTQLIDKLKSLITDNLEVSEGNVTIGSPDGTPCTLKQPDTYPGSGSMAGWKNAPLPFIDRLGTQENQCEWTVKFSFAPDPAAGTFWGSSD